MRTGGRERTTPARSWYDSCGVEACTMGGSADWTADASATALAYPRREMVSRQDIQMLSLTGQPLVNLNQKRVAEQLTRPGGQLPRASLSGDHLILRPPRLVFRLMSGSSASPKSSKRARLGLALGSARDHFLARTTKTLLRRFALAFPSSRHQSLSPKYPFLNETLVIYTVPRRMLAVFSLAVPSKIPRRTVR